MAEVPFLKRAAILDTSWLLELYRVPGYFDESRTRGVQKETARIVNADGKLFVTVPVLFEVASHITHVRNGNRRRSLGKRLLEDIEKSIDEDSPWTIVAIGKDVLLRSEDLIELARRFLQEAGPNYSFADISIIDLATELRKRNHSIEILAFDRQLAAYSGY